MEKIKTKLLLLVDEFNVSLVSTDNQQVCGRCGHRISAGHCTPNLHNR